MTSIRYGIDSTLSLDLAPDAVLAACAIAPGRAVGDVREAVRAALVAPLDFPPLERSTTPEDRVALALAEGVPRLAEVVAGIVDALLERGVSAENIILVLPPGSAADNGADPRGKLPPAVAAKIVLESHDPDDPRKLAYLASTQDGRPIYLNRSVCEADVAIPVGCLRCHDTVGYHGVADCIYPALADTKTLRRFRARWIADAPRSHAESSSREVEEVAWLLGTYFTVQVVPGAGDEVLHVLAGALATVAEQGRRLCEAAWHVDVPQRAELVVATVSGGASQQTWSSIGRALDAASRAVADGGVIALCCDLEAEPPAAVQQVSRAGDLNEAMSGVRADRGSDALPAAQLVRALNQARVFLLSRLDESTVEDLEMAPVARPEEIARLARRHGSCILLADAQYAVARPLGE